MVFLFEGYRCRHNFEPGRIQCLSSQDIYLRTGTYSMMLSARLAFQWQRTHSLGNRDSMKASITGPPALHFPKARPDLRSQKLTSPVEDRKDHAQRVPRIERQRWEYST